MPTFSLGDDATPVNFCRANNETTDLISDRGGQLILSAEVTAGANKLYKLMLMFKLYFEKDCRQECGIDK